MSRFAVDRAEQLRRETDHAFATLAFRQLYFLPVDVKRDAEFLTRVLAPILRRYIDNPNFTVSEATQLRHRDGARSAGCKQIEYTGPVVADDSAPQPAAWLGETELPDVDELASNAHGVLALVRQPYLLPATDEETAALNRAVLAGERGQWRSLMQKIARSRREMARAAGYATLNGLDYGTMQRIVIEAFFDATRLGVELPRTMRAIADAAFLRKSPLTPFGRAVTQKNATRIMFDFFIDFERLRFYSATLADERQVNSIAAAVAAERNGELDDEVLLGEAAHNNKRRAVLDDSGVDQLLFGDDASSAYSVATTSVSVTSQRSVPGLADYSFERNPYGSALVPSELSDRLRGDELVARPAPPLPNACALTDDELARVPSVWLERAPPPAFVESTRIAMVCAVRLLDQYCGRRIDRWRTVDYYYLHQLATLPAPPSASQLRAVYMLDGVLDAVADVDELAELVRATRDESTLPETARVTPLVRELFGSQVQLHAVLDSFQTRTDQVPRQRRSRASLLGALRVEQRELRDFIEHFELLWFEQRLSAVWRAQPDAALTYVLRFDADAASPLALLTSVRAFAPHARDGVDFLVVWTPLARAEYKNHHNDDNEPGDTTPPYIYLALSHTLWRRLVLGATPRAIAERRATGATVEKAPLAAPMLLHALCDADADNVIDALGAVQTLCTTLQGSAPTMWQPGIDARRLGARHAVNALRAVASGLAPAGNWARRQAARVSKICAGLATRRQDNDGGRTTRLSSVFSALQVALTAEDCYVFIGAGDAHALVTHTGVDLLDNRAPVAAYVAAQLRATDENRQRQRAEDAVATLAVEAPLAPRPVLAYCLCQTSAQECDRMLRQVENGSRHAPTCCLCERMRAECSDGRRRKRAAGRYAANSEVEACGFCRLQHPVSSTQAHKGYVQLYAPGDLRTLSPAQLVVELAREHNAEWMCMLRIGRRADRVNDTPLPRDAAERTAKKRGSRDKHRVMRASVERIVAATKREATSSAPRPLDNKRLLDAELCALLIALEMAALVPHSALIAADAKSDGPGAEPMLGPLDENAIAALVDRAPPEPPVGAELLFPLCTSAIAESTAPAGADDRYMGERVDGKQLRARSELLLYGGRVPRPLARSPSAFAELVLLHYYAPEQ